MIVKSDPSLVAPRSLLDLIERTEKIFKKDEAAYWRNRNTRKIYIRELVFSSDRSAALLLLSCTTGNLPDEAFADLKTNKERIIEMLENEGKQETAHLAISLQPQPDKMHRYFAVLEIGDALNRATTEAFLNFLFRKIGQADPKAFSYAVPSGEADASGRTKKLRYSSQVELQGHISDSFREDLKSGRLNGIQLTKILSDGSDGVGEGKYVRSRKQIVKLQSKTNWKDHPFESLAESARLARDNKYEQIRVAFTSTDKMPHSVDIDPVTENVIGDAFTKKVRIGPFSELKRLSAQALDKEIFFPMLALLNGERADGEPRLHNDSFNLTKAPNLDRVPDTQTV